MEKDIKELRIEDLIQREFDNETRHRGYAVPDRNSATEKAKEEEEREIFLWLMPLIHENGLNRVAIWVTNLGIDLETESGKKFHYTPKSFNGAVAAFDNLLLKMAATGKVEFPKRVSSYVELTFKFRCSK